MTASKSDGHKHSGATLLTNRVLGPVWLHNYYNCFLRNLLRSLSEQASNGCRLK